MTTTRIWPVQRISDNVLGPTLGPEETVAPCCPWDWAVRWASMNTSATVTALPVPSSEVPVNESRQMEVRASARLCPCPWWGRTGNSVSLWDNAFSMMRPSLPGSCPHSLKTDSSRDGWITR